MLGPEGERDPTQAALDQVLATSTAELLLLVLFYCHSVGLDMNTD